MNAGDVRITAANVDLTNCDREQIQFSNAVQPHAALLVVDPDTLKVLQASENAAAMLGMPVTSGLTLASLFPGDQGHLLLGKLRELPPIGPPQHLLRLDFEAVSRNVFGHRNSGGYMLEVESDGVLPADSESSLYRRLHAGVSELHASTGLIDALARAVRLVADISGFERVMAYRFMQDGSGEVVAESVNEGLERFLGLHYPSADIPAPARRLFSLTWLRYLPDVDYRPVPILPALNPLSGDAVDLSYAFSRSVSVMYTDYLRNMGVKATMVLTLFKGGKLWGLISCMHHSSPHHLSYEARGACELLCHVISLLMAAKEDVEFSGYRRDLSDRLNQYMDSLNRGATLQAALCQGPLTLLDAMECSGAALIENGKAECLGQTPAPEVVEQLVEQLAGRIETVWSTDKLSEACAAGRGVVPLCSGLLAVRLGRKRADFILWFRPEYLQTVSWAGDPNKPVEISEENGVTRLMPRGSFATWRAEVRGKSKPWQDCELKFAEQLLHGIVEVAMERSRKINELNTELAKSAKELDEFVYIASHDLREPLRGIHSYAEFLHRSAGERLTEVEVSRLEAIERLARRLDSLIEGLLEYTRAGHAEMMVENLDLNILLAHVQSILQAQIEATHTAIRIPRRLPTVACDPLQMQQLFMNLIGNALKYNDKPERWIEVGWTDSPARSYYVRDNGIGIAPGDVEAIFKMFQRLHRREEFGGGTGAGLTIVKKTVERHGGRIWLDSVPGEGSTFHFTLGSENDAVEKKGAL